MKKYIHLGFIPLSASTMRDLQMEYTKYRDEHSDPIPEPVKTVPRSGTSPKEYGMNLRRRRKRNL